MSVKHVTHYVRQHLSDNKKIIILECVTLAWMNFPEMLSKTYQLTKCKNKRLSN